MSYKGINKPMKIIVTTCDKNIHVLRGFAYMFNKHWSSNIDVTVLGYSIPSFDLPNNFKFISLGEQKKYGRDWTSALIPFFKQLPDEYFILLLEDYYILHINKSLLYEAEEFMAMGIEKIHLTKYNHLGWRISGEEKGVNFNIIKQDATYRLSLQPIFIRRDYFLKYLNPGKNAWEYEGQHFKNDGAQILAPKQGIVSFSHILQRGKITGSGQPYKSQILRIKKEDLNAIKQLGGF